MLMFTSNYGGQRKVCVLREGGIYWQVPSHNVHLNVATQTVIPEGVPCTLVELLGVSWPNVSLLRKWLHYDAAALGSVPSDTYRSIPNRRKRFSMSVKIVSKTLITY